MSQIIYSSDDTSKINYVPYNCPICYNIIWRDLSSYICNECENKFCYNFFNNIKNNNNSCPFCRQKLEYLIPISEINTNSNNNNEITNRNSNNTNKCSIKESLIGILIFLLFINAIYIVSYL